VKIVKLAVVSEVDFKPPASCSHCAEPLKRGNLRGTFFRDEHHTLTRQGESTGDLDLGDAFHLTAVWCRACGYTLAGEE
jgi:hypothetical protein